MTTDLLIGRVEPDGLVVVTNCADDVPLGARFTELAKRRCTSPSPDLAFLDLRAIATVDLALDGVTIFRKQFDIIPAGWSAGVRLSGTGLDLIIEVFNNKAKQEQVFLR
jgi:hypothetical protein